MEQSSSLQTQLLKYQQKQQQWLHQRTFYLKTITMLQQQLKRQQLLMKSQPNKVHRKHKRIVSQDQNIIMYQNNLNPNYYSKLQRSRNWLQKTSLKSHLDSIRCLLYCQQGQYMFSGGDDSLLKLWHNQQLLSTLRQHLGPIYTLYYSPPTKSLITGGAQGVLRLLKLSADSLHCEDELDLHNDCIWCLIGHEQLLITGSSDGTHKAVRIGSNSTLKQQATIKLGQNNPITALSWHLPGQSLITSCMNINKLVVWDLQKQYSIKEYIYNSDVINNQSNKIITNKTGLIISAHQDNLLRFYDIKQNNIIKILYAHADSITTVQFNNCQYQIITGSHDGNLRVWDIRKFKCINNVAMSMNKYDQSINCLVYNHQKFQFGVGGADGNIKIMQFQ